MALVSTDPTQQRARDNGAITAPGLGSATPATLPEVQGLSRQELMRGAASALVPPSATANTYEVRADPVRINTDGSVTYKPNAAARTQAVTVQAVAADVSRVDPVLGPDGRTQVGVQVTFVRAGTTDVLGTATLRNGPISYWGARGAAHSIDPTRIKVRDNFAVGVERRDPNDPTKVTGLTGAIFKPDSYTPNPRQ